MTLDEALEAAQQAKDEDLRGQFPMAVRVLAEALQQMREHANHLNQQLLRMKSAAANR